jgi:hypothetical protein
MSGSDWRDDPRFEGIEDPEPEPTRTARTGQEGSWAISEADRRWAAEMSDKGLLGPHRNPVGRLGHKPGRWSRAIRNFVASNPGSGLPGTPQ